MYTGGDVSHGGDCTGMGYGWKEYLQEGSWERTHPGEFLMGGTGIMDARRDE